MEPYEFSDVHFDIEHVAITDLCYNSILLWYGLYGQSIQSPKEDLMAQTILMFSMATVCMPWAIYAQQWQKYLYTLSEPVKWPLLKSIVIDMNIYAIINYSYISCLWCMSPPRLRQYSSSLYLKSLIGQGTRPKVFCNVRIKVT